MKKRMAVFAASLSGLLGVAAAACDGGGSSGRPGPQGPQGIAGESEASDSKAHATQEPPVANCAAGGEWIDVGEVVDGGFAIQQTAYVCDGGATAGDAGAVDATAAGQDGSVSAAPDAEPGADAAVSDAGTTPDSVNGPACVYAADASVECCGSITIQSTGADGGSLTDHVSIYKYGCQLFTVLPTTIDFGNVTVGSSSQITLDPSSIACPGLPNTNFGVSAGAFPTSRSGTIWTVGFFPQGVGPQSTTLQVIAESSNSCENLSIPITGTGVLPDGGVTSAGDAGTGD
jgi:hypothetical protein